ncbi:MAG TPA: radical SAM protein [Candidatus Paceibacterota bacterium]|jgi:radical SAM protein with 4Fe4S-binding SPASM domain|nr:radical SAM protein [Candidatus Paceibacterota bacterium]
MECKIEMPRLEVETENSIYEIEFGEIQIEITGKCNMRCQHCRAASQPKQDMPIDQIIKIIRFARQFSPDYKEIVLSGGEPLLHRNFAEVLRQVRCNGGEFITLTTNGSLLTKEHLSLIGELSFPRFMLSVSLDSLNPEEHDKFRVYEGAFPKAVAALRQVAESGLPNVVASMRSTIRASQIGEMENMVDFARNLGCKRVSFSAIHPAGRAIERDDLWMTREQKYAFVTEVYRLKALFPDLNVTTNDPLKCLLRGENDMGKNGELVFDGCSAGAITFNVNSDGTMTPCALLDIPMMNTFSLSIEEMTERYRENPIVKNMLEMNLKGKCGACHLKYQCGGCRARALIQMGDFLEEDPHCWL